MELAPGTSVAPRRPHAGPRRPARRVASTLVREQTRLRLHFRAVLAELRAQDTAHLSGAQRRARARLIDELARYARAGRFPRNREFPGARVPAFIDAAGTRCAMAHLIESTGARGLVARVAATLNHARIPELAGDPELQAWLAQAGLSAAEAARIQPDYCFQQKAEECFCTYEPSTTIVEGTVLATDDPAGQVVARIEAVHGETRQLVVGDSIAAQGNSESVEVGELVLILDDNSGFAVKNRVDEDGNVVIDCPTVNWIPTLSKEQAIEALLEPTRGGDDKPCTRKLLEHDDEWNDSICEGCDCAAGESDPGGSLLIGTAFAIAALLRRRRRRRSRAQVAARMQ